MVCPTLRKNYIDFLDSWLISASFLFSPWAQRAVLALIEADVSDP